MSFWIEQQDQHTPKSACRVGGGCYLCGGDVLRRPDPGDRVADLFDGIDERAHVASDIVEQVNGRHRAGARSRIGSNRIKCTMAASKYSNVVHAR